MAAAPVRRRSREWNIVRSATYAYSGLAWSLRRTPPLRLAVAVGVLVAFLAVLLRLSLIEVALLVLAGTVLLSVETLNTAVELLCDRVQPLDDPDIGRIKDVAAGATAWTELGAAAVLAVVLVPHVVAWLG